ncbi:MAG: hypothetical protein BWK79_06740 [Beggiatoa sp. IS2]|nr:MAG: hypothetical protein BWK79_06740 [Beggiatoa sp. IS2]
MVYVIDIHGNPLMPTQRLGKVRRWLKQGQAIVVGHSPFTIKLLFETGNCVQSLTLGIDTGYKTVGISVVSSKQELLSTEIQLRIDVSEKLTEKRMYRRNRRNRLRYRQPRFLNRKKAISLAPSVLHKINSHLRIIKWVKSLLPIAKIVMEMGNFDPHKLKNPEIKGIEYQQGEQWGYENVKAYILARDGHRCYFYQANQGNCSEKLHVHHLIYRSNGGTDAPSNLITLCEKHHALVHKNRLKLARVQFKSLKSATIMNIVNNPLCHKLPTAQTTFGYMTKVMRTQLSLAKSRIHDAYVIAGGNDQQRLSPLQLLFKRKNNRSLQRLFKGNKRSLRTQRYPIQPNDIIEYDGKIYPSEGTHCKDSRGR